MRCVPYRQLQGSGSDMKTTIPWIAIAFALALPAQQATFTSSTQLVVETVIAKDKKGNPIEGLTAKDFTLTEDGKPQTIAFVEYQKLPELAADLMEPILARGEAIPKLARTQISSEKPGEIRYRDHRLLALYFDISAMPPPDQMRALAAAQKF